MDNFKTSMIHFSKHSAVDVTSYVQSVFDSVEGQKSDQTKIELKDCIKNDSSIDDNTNEETTFIIHKYNINDNYLLNPNTPTCKFLKDYGQIHLPLMDDCPLNVLYIKLICFSSKSD